MAQNLGLKNFENWNIEGGGPNKSDILQNSSPPEIMSPIFNL